MALAAATPERTEAEHTQAEHTGPGISYNPSLDGLRAFGVLAVMAFHGGIPFMNGGFLGVDLFFVLSGYLITTLLCLEILRTTKLRLLAFWARRARRLLPALIVMLLFVFVAYRFWTVAGSQPDLRGDGLATLFYVANWHAIFSGGSYFVTTGPPSPLLHTWSLAIEEQFYLIWPLVLLVVLHLSKDLRVLLGVCVGGALASALTMALLFHPGQNTAREYYGTDTHSQCLLVGAALAVALLLYGQRRGSGDFRLPTPGRRASMAIGATGVLGAVVVGVLWTTLDGSMSLLYRGGFLIAAIASAAVILAVVVLPRLLLSRFLALAPLRYIGRISYGMYLWSVPLFLLLGGDRVHLYGYPLFLVRSGVTIAVATASFYLLEQPVRQGRFLTRGWRGWVTLPVALTGTATALIVLTQLPATAVGQVPSANAAPAPAARTATDRRVLLMGDSTAFTIGWGLRGAAGRYHAVLTDDGALGCGVTLVDQIESHGVISPPVGPCDLTSPVDDQWPALWAKAIAQVRPNIVAILAGRWEVADAEIDGHWTDILDPSYARYVRQRLVQAVTVASAYGAHVSLFTAPCYSSGEQPNGAQWPQDSLARVDEYNRLVKSVAAQFPSRVSVVNLFALACPDGRFRATVGSVTIRTPDGIHFPYPDSLGDVPAFLASRQYKRYSSLLGRVLWPEILDQGRPAPARP